MKEIQEIINDYIRCTKAHLIVKEDLSGFSLWRPFIQETKGGPFEILRHRSGNDAINYFIFLLRTNGSLVSNFSRDQYDMIYRFNKLVERSKDLFTDAYLCQTLDELKIVNISSLSNKAYYAVLFPRDRVLWKDKDVEQLRRYVADHYASLSLGQRMFEEDCFKKERERMARLSIGTPVHKADKIGRAVSEPIIRMDFDRASISIVNGDKEEELNLQPLLKAWLIYFILNRRPILYSEIKSDSEVINNYYDLCDSLSKERRGRPRKENSSLKPGLIIRKINDELARCCDAVGIAPGTIAVMRTSHISSGAKQVDVPKMLLGAKIEVKETTNNNN